MIFFPYSFSQQRRHTERPTDREAHELILAKHCANYAASLHMDVSDWISVFRTMTEDLPRIGSLASLDPNKAFPIDLTSHASVGGLILLGSLVVFVVGWAVLAVAIYCWRGRKAPVIFPHGPDARNSIVCVKLEEHESHDPKKVKLQHVNKKTNISDCSMIGIDKSIASSSRYLTPSSCKRAPTTSSRRDMNREDFEEPL